MSEINLPSKPRYGDACNGCGLCCAVALCRVGELMFPGAPAPCPALKITPGGTRTYCQVIATEIAFDLPPVVQEALGVGSGCGMEDDVEPHFCTIDETQQ